MRSLTTLTTVTCKVLLVIGALVLLQPTTSNATLITLFDGSGVPEDQGWTVFTSLGGGNIGGGGTVPPGELSIVSQSGGGLSDTLTVETSGGPAILQKNRGMIGRSPGRLRRNPVKSQAAKIELVDKNIDHPNRVVVTDPVFQPIRNQGALPAIHALDKTLHQTLPPKHGRIIGSKKSVVDVFTHGVTRDWTEPDR